ncbi:hypothetical protein WV31_19075 [Magnetospirillum sp. ME-1]|uniref:hypothetical protein n=1 Tax=Magnetospirillum sp. ME-1 TaxID=1639348 RepID=UPI000A17D831|nr:hypothetical protein [Magnetospirillum sp. ME-1]ARJ67606.1 hypothetical protein WV31_19075 [Magnetospirillum sp. ME-1]
MNTFDNVCTQPSMTWSQVIDCVKADSTLTNKVRENLIRDTTRVAEMLSKMLKIAAPVDQVAMASLFDKLTPAKMKFATDGGLSAFKSNVRRALRVSGIKVTDGRANNKLTQAWQTLVDQITDTWTQAELSGFVHYVSDNGWEPWMITSLHFEKYSQHRAISVLPSKARKLTTNAAKAWRKAKQAVADWPSTEIAPEILTDWTYALPWSAFPTTFRADTDGFVGVNTNNPLGWLEDSVGRKPKTVTNYMDCIRRMASILVRMGTPAESLTSLRDLVTLDNANTILKFVCERTNRKKGGQIGLMAFLLYYIARDWLHLEGPLVQRLKQIHQSTKQKAGMAEKTRRRLRQFENEELLDRTLWLADTLLVAAKNMPIDIHSAKLVRTATYLALAFDTCSRSINIAALDFDTHFFTQGDRVWLEIPDDEVKNGEDLRAELRPETIATIHLYVESYRAVHCVNTSSLLFPRKDGTAWTTSQAYDDVMDFAARYAGCELHPHLIRSIATKLILDDSPNALPIAQHCLGHRTMRTTAASYLAMSKTESRKQYHRVFDDARRRWSKQ